MSIKINKIKKALSLFLTVAISGCINSPLIVKTGLEGMPLPNFNILMIDSITHLSTSEITPGKPTVLFSFAPWCPYCKAQTAELISHIEDLKDINIYMITTASLPELKKFYYDYALNKFHNIKIGQDDSNYFGGYFKTNIVPYFAIYSKDKKLKRVLKGKSSIRLVKEIAVNQ
jgi:thiol-disulfide isomerase/thioredoxin